jgi:hypothetical protein
MTKVHRNLQDDINSGNVFVCEKCPQRIYRSSFALGRHYREYHNIRKSFSTTPKAVKTPKSPGRPKTAIQPFEETKTEKPQSPEHVRRRSSRVTTSKEEDRGSGGSGSEEIEEDKENDEEIMKIDEDIKVEKIDNDAPVQPVNEKINGGLVQYECGYCRLAYETGTFP